MDKNAAVPSSWRSRAIIGAVAAGGLAFVAGIAVALTDTDMPHQRPIHTSSDIWADPERSGLFDGRVESRSPSQVDVGETFEVRVDVCAYKTVKCQATNGPAVKVGALVRAWLSADPRLPVVMDQDPVQAITDPSDVATWIWLVKALEPGRYTVYLHLVATTNQGQPLLPEAIFEVAIMVDSTIGHKIARAANAIQSGITSVGGILSALGLSSVSAIAIALWRKRKARRGTANEHNGEANGDKQTEPVNTPKQQNRRKSRKVNR